MRIDYQQSTWTGWSDKLLKILNLRAEESERTILMFAFYTATSVGLSWLEASTVALFLGEYGADRLPLIYMASAAIGIVLSFVYSWMQQVLPLRRVIVLVALLLAVPLVMFRFGLDASVGTTVAGISALSFTVMAMRLWLEAVYVLNDLNTSITANQLFNIREIKRTFPLINSGILVADVIGGFSLPILVKWFGLPNVILVAAVAVAIGALILYYLSETYRQFFPDSRVRRTTEEQMEFATSRLQQPLKRYIGLLFAFFVMAQVLYLLVDFQFLTQLELWNVQGSNTVEHATIGGAIGFLGVSNAKTSTDRIASFLGLFQGFLGIVEISTQWFASSRLIERLGVFVVTLLLPVLALVLSFALSLRLLPLFSGFVLLKFLDEWVRYTLLNSSSPVLFQPLPDDIRSDIQSVVRGNAEPISTGMTGLVIFGALLFINAGLRNWIFISLIILISIAWIAVIWVLRSRYVSLLVSGAERGELSLSAVDLPELKRRAMETLNRQGADDDKRSCIELLSHIDPKNAGDVLSPVLATLPAELQRQSLDVMMLHPSATYLPQVKTLINQPLAPEVLAMALRYIWLTEAEPNIRQLRPYLRPEVDPVVRGTAASLMLRLGDSRDKAEATNTLRQMLTHRRERERVMGCRALGEALYMQALRLYIPNLLQDESLRVRCALLEAISATHLEEYYPSLLKGLTYKSTREAAMRSLVRLENEALTNANLISLAEDIHKPESVRLHAWGVIGQIGTIEARNVLVSHLMTAWGKTRRNIADILLKIPYEMGINAVLDRLGRSGVEVLIEQELLFVAQLQAALADLPPEQIWGREADLLRHALEDAQTDALERIFPLLKFLYRADSIQAAAYNLQSESRSNVALGLEILDSTIDISRKWVLLSILDRRPDQERLKSLEEMVPYQQLVPSDRLRHLLELRHFLPDWPLACCFHLARHARWSATPEQIISCIRHPTGFVREAVLSYLSVASPRSLRELLPKLKGDPDRLVANQVQGMIKEIGLTEDPTPPVVGASWGMAIDNG